MGTRTGVCSQLHITGNRAPSGAQARAAAGAAQRNPLPEVERGAKGLKNQPIQLVGQPALLDLLEQGLVANVENLGGLLAIPVGLVQDAP